MIMMISPSSSFFFFSRMRAPQLALSLFPLNYSLLKANFGGSIWSLNTLGMDYYHKRFPPFFNPDEIDNLRSNFFFSNASPMFHHRSLESREDKNKKNFIQIHKSIHLSFFSSLLSCQAVLFLLLLLIIQSKYEKHTQREKRVYLPEETTILNHRHKKNLSIQLMIIVKSN